MKHQRNQSRQAKPKAMRVNCLSSDYDGTISPLGVSRNESRVPMETRVMLGRVGSLLPISIITMKDLLFIMPRTPFAHAWSAIGGLETRVGRRVLKRENLEDRLGGISLALNYARSHLMNTGVEIEEKQDSEGHTVAFCIDWRRAEHAEKAKKEAEKVAAYCKELRLNLIRYEKRPFYDVYPVAPDKGWALREMLGELGVKNGVLYLGDSETDNSAFKASSVGIGVVHDETPLRDMNCDYFVKFDDVPDFMNTLLANNLLFDSDFPMIRTNPHKKTQVKTREDKHG